LVTADPARAVEFYSALLGWESELPPDGGVDGARRMNAHGRSVAGIMPTSHPEDRSAWLTFICVERIEEAARTAVQLGATALTDVVGFPSIGSVMVLRDPQGATFCVVEPAQRGEA
jgi:predicted enzyme related to lactoylglutathione lyase